MKVNTIFKFQRLETYLRLKEGKTENFKIAIDRFKLRDEELTAQF
jgi:hypothetical protein